jgi:cytochrome c
MRIQTRRSAVVAAVATLCVAFMTNTAAFATPAKGKAKAADIAKQGEALYNKQGCVACHGLKAKDTKKIGPNFAEVAKNHKKSDINKLAKKIRAGGKGEYGQIPMPPMPQVSEADAKVLAEYVLTFKGK